MIMTVPFSETPLPKVTLPETVKWSNSSISGMEANLLRKSFTFLKLSPSFTKGVDKNIRSGDITKAPSFIAYKLDIINNKSDEVLTGKNLDLGTLIPLLPSKHFIAAPTAVSN